MCNNFGDLFVTNRKGTEPLTAHCTRLAMSITSNFYSSDVIDIVHHMMDTHHMMDMHHMMDTHYVMDTHHMMDVHHMMNTHYDDEHPSYVGQPS